jgi:hypothetical protein
LETGAEGAQESRGEGDGEDSEFGPAEGQNVSGEKIWGLFYKLTVTQVRQREYLLGFSEKCPKSYISLMSTHASILVDSVGPPSAEVCRAAASFP